MDSLLKREKQPTVFGANLVYLCVLLLMMSIQVILVRWLPEAAGGAEYYWKLFLLELLLIGGPALVYMLVFDMDIGKIIRFNPIKPVEAMLVMGMAIFGYGVTVIINLIWFWVVSHLGSPIGQDLPAVGDGAQFLGAILAVGVVPAVVEEFLFRGLILRGYERFGSKTAIIMTGILFGMLHLQLMSIPSIILVGIIISYVVYRTNSIFAGMIYHFLHNTITVVFLFMQDFLVKNADSIEGLPQDVTQLPDDAFIAALIVWGIIGLVALSLFTTCFIAFHKRTRDKGRIRRISDSEKRHSNFLGMLPAILAMIIVIINVILEVLYMMEIINI